MSDFKSEFELQLARISHRVTRGLSVSLPEQWMHEATGDIRAALTDTERMDFITANEHQLSWSRSECSVTVYVGENDRFHAPDFRAAIDRAIAASKEPT